MKILLFGKNGQVGWELQRSLSILGDLVAGDRTQADLANSETLRHLVRQVRPQVIVNAAAYTAVDKAEAEVDLSFRVNATAPGILAEEAEALGAWLVHYSTDYVFNGAGSTPWLETDATAPLNVYGASKLAGEEAIAAQCSRYLILRTSWVYGVRGENFAKTMLKLAQERESLAVINDQVGAPTGAELLADATAHIIRQVQDTAADCHNRLAGCYHLAAAGEASWFDYACFVLQEARDLGMKFRVPPEAVKPIPASDYPLPAIRPANSRLDCTKFRQAFDLRLPVWQEGVSRMLRQYLRV